METLHNTRPERPRISVPATPTREWERTVFETLRRTGRLFYLDTDETLWADLTGGRLMRVPTVGQFLAIVSCLAEFVDGTGRRGPLKVYHAARLFRSPERACLPSLRESMGLEN